MVRSRVRPRMLMLSMLMLAAMRPAGSGEMGGEVLGAEQALLLRRHRREEDAAARPLRHRGQALRDGQERGDAGGVVHGAVVDRVLAGLGVRADAEVVVVRGVEDRLLGQRGVAAGQLADHVGGLLLVHLGLHVEAHGGAERHRPEVLLLRGRPQRVEVLAAQLRQPPRGLVGDPGLHLELGTALVRQRELLAGPGRLDHVPAVAGRRRRVDDDGARRRPSSPPSRTCSPSGRSTGASCPRRASGRPRGRCSS